MSEAGPRVALFDSLTHPTLDGSWVDGRADARFEALDRQLSEAGVERACAVGVNGTGGYDAERFLEACARYPRLVPVAGLDLGSSGSVAERVAHVAALGYRAVKIHPRFEGRRLESGWLGEAFAAADAAGLVSLYCSYARGPLAGLPDRDPYQVLVDALRAAPRARVVLMHGGDVELLRYAELVRFNENLLLDLSFTLLRYAGSSLDDDLRCVMRTLDRRCCVGSDHPQFSPAELRARFDALSAGLPREKVENVASRSLAGFLGLEAGPERS